MLGRWVHVVELSCQKYFGFRSTSGEGTIIFENLTFSLQANVPYTHKSFWRWTTKLLKLGAEFRFKTESFTIWKEILCSIFSGNTFYFVFVSFYNCQRLKSVAFSSWTREDPVVCQWKWERISRMCSHVKLSQAIDSTGVFFEHTLSHFYSTQAVEPVILSI